MKKVSVCIVIFLVFFSLFGHPFIALASNYSIPFVSEAQTSEAMQKIVPVRLLPDSPFYFLIQIKERLGHFFLPSSLRRAEFSMILSGKRLKEALKLVESGKIDKSADSLLGYQDATEDIIKQLAKAKGQNQEVVPLSSEIADNLNSQEALLSAIYAKTQDLNNDDFDADFDTAVRSFINVAMTINQIKPGLKDRYRIVTSIDEGNSGKKGSQIEATPSAEPVQATSGVKPKRIIY